MYIAPVSDLDTLFDYEADGDGKVLSSMLHDSKLTIVRPFANFYPLEEGLSSQQFFVRHIGNVLNNDLPRGLKSSFRQGRDHKFSVASCIYFAIVQVSCRFWGTIEVREDFAKSQHHSGGICRYCLRIRYF